MARMLILMTALLVAAAAPVLAQDERTPMPPTLTFGYEDEGKIDATPAGCEVAVKEIVEWPEPQLSEAVKDVCAARKRHVEAYAAIQKSYKALAKLINEDTRLNQAAAVRGIAAMVKACIDHKSGITTGGHNIAIDIIPNEIANECLTIGKRLLDDESAWLTAAPDKHTRYSP